MTTAKSFFFFFFLFFEQSQIYFNLALIAFRSISKSNLLLKKKQNTTKSHLGVSSKSKCLDEEINGKKLLITRFLPKLPQNWRDQGSREQADRRSDLYKRSDADPEGYAIEYAGKATDRDRRRLIG